MGKVAHVWWEKPEKRNLLEDKEIDRKIILNCPKEVGWKWTG